ncbi:MAG: hypothetical protein ATN36_07975 [Epulopiscium sp. Nele67-Bin005]|nr:MAG: hypothetical protein ATN36_07975 [Epulopiscium sp. Nele67-Bin005]
MIKKIINLILVAIVIILGGFMLFSSSKPKTTTILNTLPSNFNQSVNLYFGADPTKYTLNPQKSNPLVGQSENITAYTEGFLNSFEYKKIEDLINTKYPLHYIYEDETWKIYAFAGGLEEIYIQKKDTNHIYQLNFDKSQNFGTMYVSHIIIDEDKLFILGLEAFANNALYFEAQLTDFTIINAEKLPTLTNSKYQFGLTANGTLILPEHFEYDFVITQGDFTLILVENEDFLEANLLNKNLNLVQTTKLPLPAENIAVLDILYEEEFLYLVMADTNYTKFPLYLSIYNLQTGTLNYVLGMQSTSSFAGLGR